MSNIPTGKKIYLCSPNLKPITALNGVDTESVNYSEHLRDYSSLTFDVDKYVVINGKQVKSNGYDELDVYMYLYLEDIAFFQMQYPQLQSDGQKEHKSITAYSIDKEWEDKDWVNFKCNTGEKDSLEMLVEDNTDDLGFVVNFIDFYNPERHDISLLHIILEKMPTWSVDDGDIDRLLWDKKLSFSEDSINLYALMNSVIAPKAECVFIFDCLHRKIKAVAKDNIDFDTNIFIGFRNLASSIEQSVNEDSVFTRFNVSGGNNLEINDWNYNNGRIFNIDYFMREPYMTQEQVIKFQRWINWMNDNRETFANYSQKVSDLEAKIYDLRYRVPDDGTRIDQWKKMNEEGLNESLKYYKSLMDAFEVSVDANPTYTGSNGKIYHKNEAGKFVDDNNNILPPGVTLSYNPWTVTEDGETHVDYDAYFELLSQMENGKAGYYTYYQIIMYIIPNIEVALWNLHNAPTKEDEREYDEDWEVDWELYGLEELNGVLEDYRNRVNVLKEYSADKPNADDQYKRLHDEYIAKLSYIGGKDKEGTILWWIDKLEKEIDEIGEEEREYNYKRMQMVAKASMYPTDILESDSVDYGYDVIEKPLDNSQCYIKGVSLDGDNISGFNSVDSSGMLSGDFELEYFGGNPEWGFTKEDIELFHILIHDTDYTNENILTTSLNTTSTVTSTETIIQKEKELLDDAMEKLSEISQPQISFSVDLDNIMQIPEFEGLKDDTSLLRFIRLGIHDDYSVKLRIVGRSWNPCEVSDNFTLEFSNMVTSKSGRTDLTDILNGEGGNVGKNSISIGSGNSESDKEYAANLLSLMVSTGLFSSAVSKTGWAGIDASKVNELIDNYITANVINEASFKKIFSSYIDVETLVADSIKTVDISVDQITDSQGNTFADLVNGSININSIATSIIEGQDGSGNYYIDLIAGEISIDRLTSSDGKTAVEFVNGAVSTDQIATNLISGKDGDSGYYMDLLTGHLNMNTIVANNTFTDTVQSITSHSVTDIVNDAYIQSAIVGKLSVGDLVAGNIVLTDTMQILSENGSMTMNGTALQIHGTDSDGNDYVGIQLGYDTGSNPSLILRNEDGTTILTPSGITSDAIADGLIVNDMVHNGTLSKDKLGFPIVDTDEDGNISIANIKDGSGGNFGVEYVTFKNNTDSAISNLDTKIDNSATYSLYITAPNGTNLRGGNITLQAKLYRNSIDITDEYNAQYFKWTRHSKDSYGDSYWNQEHSTGTKLIIITGNDVIISADFVCTFEYDGLTVTSG